MEQATQDDKAGDSSTGFTKEDLERAAAEAAKVAVEKFKTEVPTVKKEDIEGLLAKQRADLARAISGEKEKEELDPLLKHLLSQPGETLSILGETIKKSILEEVRGEQAAKTEIQTAATEVLGERPDIAGDPKARKLLDAFFRQADPEKPVKERLKEAVRDYDLFLEEQGLGDATTRTQKATAVSSASAGKSQPQEKPINENESFRSELEERKARHRKLTGMS